MSGALLVTGTASDAGKSVVVAALCRWLARQGVKVTPFKALNMALNSAITADGAEIGRAQAMQAAAAGIDVICEGAGSPAEINLRPEPGVRMAFADRPAAVAHADLVVLPGTKSTVADLEWLHAHGLAAALSDRARNGAPILGVCGGYQMLGGTIDDPVESGTGQVRGLDLLPVRTAFAADKVLARHRGASPVFDGAEARGYEIRHGRVDVSGGQPLLTTDDGGPEGCVIDAVIGTSWHGLLECDDLRRALLRWVGERTGRNFTVGDVSFAAVREARLDALGDLVADHLDTAAIARLLRDGAPPDLPVIPPAGASRPTRDHVRAPQGTAGP